MTGLQSSRRRLPVWFAVATVPAVVALIWLGWFVVRQDRALAREARDARLEQAADVAVSALARTIAELESQLSATASRTPPATDRDSPVPVLVFDSRGIVARSGLPLPWYPAVSRSAATLPDAFAQADHLEFAAGDPRAAARVLLAATRDESPMIRAEAWLRIARNHRKTGDSAHALDAFRELAALEDTSVQDGPAGLLGRSGRALVFAAGKQTRELAREADALAARLAGGEWRLTRAQYELASSRIAEWRGRASDTDLQPGSATRALLLAAEEGWSAVARDGSKPERSRGLVRASDSTVLMLSVPVSLGAALMLVPAPVLYEAWLNNLPSVRTGDLAVKTSDGMFVMGAAPAEARATVSRPFADSGLPWTIVAGDSEPLDTAALSAGARLTLAGILFMILLVVASGYMMMRAVSHEIRVARLQTDFVAAVSHEFRTPLTTLRQLSEMLARGRVSTDERRRQFYDAILSESARLQRLVESLLDFGRMESGRMRFKREPLDLQALVDDVAASVGREAASTGHRIEVSRLGWVPAVTGDRDALAHAIRNVLDNAVKYSPDHKVISLSLTRAGDLVSIQVGDRGLGILPEEQRQIFEKFVRGSLPSSHHIAGTGVGLAMTRQIVEAHQGTISVDSLPGKGSTFTISLPADPGARA